MEILKADPPPMFSSVEFHRPPCLRCVIAQAFCSQKSFREITLNYVKLRELVLNCAKLRQVTLNYAKFRWKKPRLQKNCRSRAAKKRPWHTQFFAILLNILKNTHLQILYCRIQWLQTDIFSEANSSNYRYRIVLPEECMFITEICGNFNRYLSLQIQSLPWIPNNSVHTGCIVKTSGFTRGVCKNRGFY